MRATVVHWSQTGLLGAAMLLSPLVAQSGDELDGILIAPASITITARAGDTLSAIATRFTSATGNWVALGKLNNISKDTAIPIGTPILIPASLLPDEPSDARVVALSGNASATGLDHQPVPLKIGTRLLEGMQIDTASNSFLSLALPDASRVSIPSNSRVRLSILRMARYTRSPRTEITILRGQVESQVSPLTPNMGRFDVRTPLATAGVRGTLFRVGILANGTTASELLTGAVEINRKGSDDNLTLQAGQGNIVSGSALGKAVALLPAPQLTDEVFLQAGASAQFGVVPQAGVAAWHLQIGTDALGQSPFAETRTSSNPIRLDGIRAGSYFVRIAAVDAFGLEGYARVVAVNLTPRETPAKTAPTPSPPFVDSSDNKLFQLRWTSPPAAGFKVQVARDAEFSWLQFNSSTLKPQLLLPRPPFGTYFARVQIQNADGSTGPFSAAQAFVVTDQWIIHEGNPIAANPGRTR